jgi:hypothetical protein
MSLLIRHTWVMLDQQLARRQHMGVDNLPRTQRNQTPEKRTR